jgi:hypothetical protein
VDEEEEMTHCKRHDKHDPRCLDCVTGAEALREAILAMDDETPAPKAALDPDPVINLCLEAMQLRRTSRRLREFMDYHRKNRGVFDFLVETLGQMRDSGYRRGGFPLAYNRCRWVFGVKQRNSEFELNNNISAHYSRAITILRPEFAGFFEQRTTANGTADSDFGYVPKSSKKGRIASIRPKAARTTPPATLENLGE